MIPQETIDDILSVSKIEEVVGDYVNLKKRGVNYVGLCPFHDEKTPSFYVSPTKEIYKCFGCGKAGNSVRFLMDHEKYSYPEALRFLARKYRIEIKEDETEEEKQQRDELASIYIVLKFAEDFYHDYLLNSEEGKSIGVTYLKNRGIDSTTIEEFKLGFSPSAKDAFTKEALQNKYKEEFLIASGLTIKTHDGTLIDRFRERVIFPIHSVSGRTLGFGGRTLKKDPKVAKYINSPETKVYNKSRVLYGLDLAKDTIRKLDEIYLAEGYTDVIALHKAGIKNVVASLGTSLTEEHTKMLKRYTNNLTFIFDGDEAGIKASLRAFDIALKEELNVKAVILPDGEDPDSFSKKNPSNEVKLYIKDNSKDFILFKTGLYFDQEKVDPIQRADVIKNIVKSIALIPNKINRSIYIRDLSKKLDIDEEVLYSELNQQLIKQKDKRYPGYKKQVSDVRQKKPAQKQGVPTELSSSEQEKEIIRLLLLYGENEFDENQTVAERIINQIKEIEWNNALYHELFNEYVEFYNSKNRYPGLIDFINHNRLDFQDTVSTFAIIKEDLSENWLTKFGKNVDIQKNYKNEVISALYHLELRKLQALLKQNIKDMKKTNLTVDEESLLQKTHIHLTSEINRISREIKLVIY